MKEIFNTFGKITDGSHKENIFDVKLERGTARFEGITQNVIRMRLTHAKSFQEDRSYSIEKILPKRTLTIEDTEKSYTIRSGKTTIEIMKDVFSVNICDAIGHVISEGKAFEYAERSVRDKRKAANEEDYFALGERMTPFGRRGYKVRNWNTDNWRHHNETNEEMYLSMPFMISLNSESKKTYGYFLDSSYETNFDLAQTNDEECVIQTQESEYDVYFIVSDNVKGVVKEYTELTGRHAMPPVWAIAYHQCKWGYKDEAEFNYIANTIREKKIPCDVLWYDIDYMDNFRVFTFDSNKFKDIKKHLDEIGKKGFKKVCIVDPGVCTDEEGGYDVVSFGSEKNHFLKEPNGDDYIGEVWPGGTKFPDFSRPETREWWGSLHKRYYDLGVDAFWNDMNEPSDFKGEDGTVPMRIKMYDDGRWSDQSRMHNVYGLLEAKATIDGMLDIKPEERPFLLTRAGFSGIQKYSAIWCGDNTSTWAHLKASIAQILNVSLSGIGYAGVDVGGFSHNATGELLARWTQLGAFYPFFRNHCASAEIYQEPWRFGEEVENVCKEAIELRYHLLPYFYQHFYEMHKYGYPVMRPMFWDYQDDEKMHVLNEQFMLGSYLLVAPVVERRHKTKTVHFPEGLWYDYFTGEKYEGGKSYVVNAPLNKIPLFVRASSVIPVMEPMETTEKMNNEKLILEVVPGENAIEEDFYEDDLRTTKYLKEEALVNEIKLMRNKLEIYIAKESEIKNVEIRFFIPATPGGNVLGFKEEGIWMKKEFKREKSIVVEY